MEGFSAIVMGFLELTFVMVALALVHRLRRVIGSGSFVMLFSVLLVLAQFLLAAGMELQCGTIGWISIQMPLGLVVVMMPCMASVLLIYANEGTLATQRLIVGMAIALGMFYYIGKLTQIQSDWVPYSLTSVSTGGSLKMLFERIFNSLFASVLLLLEAVFLMPIIYTKLRRLNISIFISLFCSLFFAMLLAALIYTVFGNFDTTNDFGGRFASLSLLVMAVALYLSGILTIYLLKVEKEKEGGASSPLEIVFAFVTGYGKFKALERNFSEWENRHQIVMQNASDMILLLNRDGVIQDANQAAVRTLHYPDAKLLVGVNFFDMAKLGGNPTAEVDASDPTRGIRRKITMTLEDGAKLVLDMVLSEAMLKKEPMFLLMGRDITEESRMSAERVSLSEQVAHLQRLEALGRLTGGIAHDFNNYIHAILGHLDLLEMKYNLNNPELLAHIHKIGDVAEQAGKLTGQLLGFARKGKYQVVEMDLRVLVKRAIELFLPNKAQQIELVVELGNDNLMINGDPVQLQQVMLNLLLNAFDAMKFNPHERRAVLIVRTGIAEKSPIEAEPPRAVGVNSPHVNVDNYYYVMISDTGCGMDKKILEHAFDPFFTTKPIGEGTGMGLPMVYGAITNHYGWVQIKSKLDFGTSVLLFLPRASVTPQPIQAEVKL